MPPIFNKCRASINFYEKGLSPHFSGVVNALFSGMKTYGLDTQLVSEEFKNGGKYTHIGKWFLPEEDETQVAKKIVDDLHTLENGLSNDKI